jgi:hypothetical protein
MQVCNEMKHGGHCRDANSGFINKMKAKIITLVVIWKASYAGIESVFEVYVGNCNLNLCYKNGNINWNTLFF